MITKKTESFKLNNKIKKNKTKKHKTKKHKTKQNNSKHNKLNTKTINNKLKTINNKLDKVELSILINIISNTIIELLKKNKSKKHIKIQIIKLLKDIRQNNKLIKINATDKELTLIFDTIYKQSKLIYETKKFENNNLSNHKFSTLSTHSTNSTQFKDKPKLNKGGFFFKNIEDKGDQPITGNDMSKLLTEIQDFFYNAQWTEEGAFLRDPNTLLSMLRGDVEAFQSYITWRIIPKYIQWFPPFIQWEEIKKAFNEKKYEDLPDYLLAYQTYMRSQDEYLVEKGLKSPDVLNKDLYTGFYNKLSHSLDDNILKFQKLRGNLKGTTPVPVLDVIV
jgi:hypothetical protein